MVTLAAEKNTASVPIITRPYIRLSNEIRRLNVPIK